MKSMFKKFVFPFVLGTIAICGSYYLIEFVTYLGLFNFLSRVLFVLALSATAWLLGIALIGLWNTLTGNDE